MARWRMVTRLHRLACYLAFWLAPMTSGSSPTRRQIQSPSGFAFVPSRDICTTAISRSFVTSSARASIGADRETKRLCRLQIGCQPEASREFERQVAQCSAPLLTTAPPRHSGQRPMASRLPKAASMFRSGGTATTGTIATVADGTTPTPQLASVLWCHRRPTTALPHGDYHG